MKAIVMPLTDIEDLHPCSIQMQIVRKTWPNGIPLTSRSMATARRLKLDASFLVPLLSSNAEKVYLKAMNRAETAYQKAMATAWEAYQHTKAKDTARQTYQDATVLEEEVYQEAMAKALLNAMKKTYRGKQESTNV